MADANAGKVAPRHKGEWDSTTTYHELDIVTHNSIAWWAVQDNTGQEPVKTDETYWKLLVEPFGSSDISYDNTSSGLTSTTIQDAVDELNTKVNSVDGIANATTTSKGIVQVGEGINVNEGTISTDSETVPYDNTTSELDATNVKAALDEIVSKTYINYQTATWQDLLGRYETWAAIYKAS